MKVFSSAFETLLGSSSTILPFIQSIFSTTIAIPKASSSALITSKALLLTIEYISKLKNRYTKLRDWMKAITLLRGEILKKSMFDRKTLMKKNLSKIKKCT